MKKGEAVKPYRVFLSGPGGVGKSYVISLIHRDTVKLLRLSGQVEPEDVIVQHLQELLLSTFRG